MFRNIVLGLIIICIAYVGYQIFDIYYTRGAASSVEEPYKLGSESANLNVVEFLDYACPYCRKIHPTITEAVRRDGRVTFIPRPVAFMDDSSIYAALTVYAAAEQNKFFEVHNMMIEHFEDLDQDNMPTYLQDLGVDLEKLDAAVKSGNLQKKIIENSEIFRSIGTGATPTFIIGDAKIYVPQGQMPSVEDFLDMFAEVRGEK